MEDSMFNHIHTKDLFEKVETFLLSPHYDSFYPDDAGQIDFYVSVIDGELHNLDWHYPTVFAILDWYNASTYDYFGDFWDDFINDKEAFFEVCFTLTNKLKELD